ncbi:unnamed protein product [Clonostachys byssicola]|uniref:Transcription factor domain-containing protein n=1 Tax=Clonostachys byssicola TaxID=160290 RepID=A0A9N9UYN5_9HYPO|nr:unnamed protein product [Clonostachys byssicola]
METVKQPSSEDHELLQAGQFYRIWCHNQPLCLFRNENFLDSLRHRDKELCLAIKLLGNRFSPGQMTPEKREALNTLSHTCRKLVADRIHRGKIRLSTLQTLCLLSITSFADGYAMQAGYDLETAQYFACGIPVGSSLGDPVEYTLCIQSISLLQSLQGSIPDILEAGNNQSPFQNRNRLLEVINHRANRLRLLREPSTEKDLDSKYGILTYMARAAEAWHLTRAYAAMRVGPDSLPPWHPESDYALINLKNFELDSQFPLKYRFATNDFGGTSPEVLKEGRDYWGPWIFIQFIHAAIPTLLNHPFLLSLRLKNFRHKIPQTFMYQSFDLISKHTAWIICYLDLVEKQEFHITDPTIAHAVLIVATIHLQHSFVDDSVLRTKAQHGYDKCLRFLDRYGTSWPLVFNMTRNLRKLQDSVSTVQMSNNDSWGNTPSWSIDAQLLWDILVLEKAGHDQTSEDRTMYEDMVTTHVEHREQDVGENLSIVGSAGISGHKGALREISAYAPQDKDPYETLRRRSASERSADGTHDFSVLGDYMHDASDNTTIDESSFLLQAEDFGRAVKDWINFDMTDVV